MCGIVGAVAQRDVAPILVEGLKRLEYRGYDSAGVAVLNASAQFQRIRTTNKVRELVSLLASSPMQGGTGIAQVAQGIARWG